jgi:hypothetical protein
VTVGTLPDVALLEIWKYSFSMRTKLVGQSDGRNWCAYADDGDTSFLHHKIVTICKSTAQKVHLCSRLVSGKADEGGAGVVEEQIWGLVPTWTSLR